MQGGSCWREVGRLEVSEMGWTLELTWGWSSRGQGESPISNQPCKSWELYPGSLPHAPKWGKVDNLNTKEYGLQAGMDIKYGS